MSSKDNLVVSTTVAEKIPLYIASVAPEISIFLVPTKPCGVTKVAVTAIFTLVVLQAGNTVVFAKVVVKAVPA